ncbi:MAG: non-canonical purine NTP pyrophosphatase, partial [Rhodospirillaceae bacterium]|nr:non-canonical purine NTP pyrophosphatase [Rhodospirillaceae bacterium]
RAAAAGAGRPARAGAAGLVVPALGGAPGIHSARWAGPGRDFHAAMERVERALAARGPGVDRRAFFVCALALAWPDGHCDVFEGRVNGRLVWPPRGERGFGYDPVFVADGHDTTFGEMEPAAKHAMSHRADAFRKLVAACFA